MRDTLHGLVSTGLVAAAFLVAGAAVTRQGGLYPPAFDPYPAVLGALVDGRSAAAGQPGEDATGALVSRGAVPGWLVGADGAVRQTRDGRVFRYGRMEAKDNGGTLLVGFSGLSPRHCDSLLASAQHRRYAAQAIVVNGRAVGGLRYAPAAAARLCAAGAAADGAAVWLMLPYAAPPSAAPGAARR